MNRKSIILCITLLTVLAIALRWIYSKYTYIPLNLDAQSYPKFKDSIREIKNLISNRDERGSHLVVYQNNEKVIEIKSGFQDELYLLPWVDSTLVQIYSLSVFSVIFTFADLFNKYKIDENSKIFSFLPDYSDKNATISDLLNNLLGFPYLDQESSLSKYQENFDEFMKQFYNAVPNEAPRKDRYFHFHTMSFIADAIVRSVDSEKKRSLSSYFSQEFIWQNNLDIISGLPRTSYYRLARNYHCTWTQLISSVMKFDLKAHKSQPVACDCDNIFCYLLSQNNSPRCKSMISLKEFNFLKSFNPDTLEVPLTSINMFSNAKSLAKLFNMVFSELKYNFTKNPTVMKWLTDTAEDRSLEWDYVLNRYVKYNSAGLLIEESPLNTQLIGFYEDIMGHWVFYDKKMNLTMAYVTNHAHCVSHKNDWIKRTIIESIYAALI